MKALFWKNFGPTLKEGLCEHAILSTHQKILSLCRFYSAQSPDKLISLDEYIGNMKPEQGETIYFITGPNVDTLVLSPQIEGFVKRDIDVLFFVDGVDEFWITSASLEYNDKKLKPATHGDIELGDVDDTDKDGKSDKKKKDSKKDDYSTEEQEDFTKFVKDALQDKIGKVKISKRLVSSPACIVTPEGDIGVRMERFLSEQGQLKHRRAKDFEVNMEHPAIKTIVKCFKDEKLRPNANKLIYLIFEQAWVTEGETMINPSQCMETISSLITAAYE